jgi:hypothetical protein
VTAGVYITSGISHERLARALAAVARERTEQTAKWGEQNHPDGTGPQKTVLDGIGLRSGQMALARPGAHSLAYFAKLTTDQRAEEGRVTWADILLEEVFEALAEADPVRLRKEIVQVAAVAVQWVEKIDRDLDEARDFLGEQP